MRVTAPTPASFTIGRLAGRVAVITGAGNGIGRASALRLASDGAKVVVADVMEAPAAETVRLITEAGGEAVSVIVDAVSRSDNEAMSQVAVQTWGRLDILLTAAGISHANYRSGDTSADVKMMGANLANLDTPWRTFIDLDVEAWQRVIDVNLTGTFLAMQACADKMVDFGHGGSIVTIASIAAKNPDAGPLAYTVSKAGVWMLTKKAARELAAASIRVNAIGPGYIATNMTQMIELLPEERRNDLALRIPLGRVGRPDEVASVVSFLASDDASYMTGTILHPDGGYFTD